MVFVGFRRAGHGSPGDVAAATTPLSKYPESIECVMYRNLLETCELSKCVTTM